MIGPPQTPPCYGSDEASPSGPSSELNAGGIVLSVHWNVDPAVRLCSKVELVLRKLWVSSEKVNEEVVPNKMIIA